MPAPTFPPEAPIPLPCEMICGPSFTLVLPENLTWPAGTYYFRVAIDARPAQVCSVVFEPVFGASQSNCGPESAGFAVNYRYDSEVQRIESIDFNGALRHLQVEVLTAENAPHVFDFADDLRLVRTYSCAACVEYRPSGNGMPEVDAGVMVDGGNGTEPSDASTGLESDAGADSGAD